MVDNGFASQEAIEKLEAQNPGIRIQADDVRITGRQGMGVTLMRLSEGERVISCFPVSDEGEDEEAAENTND